MGHNRIAPRAGLNRTLRTPRTLAAGARFGLCHRRLAIETLEDRRLLSGTSWPGGALTSDPTWTAANSPYNLTGSVEVRNGHTLTIQPGVQVTGGDLYVNDDGSGGTLWASGATFADSLHLYAGAQLSTFSGNTFNSGQSYVAPLLASALSANSFAGNSTVDVIAGTVTTSATFPSLANVAKYDFWGGTLNVNSGGSLAIASGVTIANDNSLRVSSDGSGGSLSAAGVTFQNPVYIGSAGHLAASGASFQNSLWLYSGAQLTASSLSGVAFSGTNSLYVAPELESYAAGATFPAGSTAYLINETLTTSVTLPSIGNVTTLDMWGGWLNVNGGASLTIPSGVTVANDNPLRISSDGSGGSLAAAGVTFQNAVYIGSAAHLAASGATFRNSLWLYSGAQLTASSLSGVAFSGTNSLYVAPELESYAAGATFPAGSTVYLINETLTTSVTLPSIGNVTTLDIWGGWLNVNGGASLTIPSGMLVTNDDPLRISSDGSGGTLAAAGVTFQNAVYIGSAAHLAVSGAIFRNTLWMYSGAQLTASSLSGVTFSGTNSLYVAPELESYAAGAAFPAGSTVYLINETLTTSVTLPSIGNVTTLDIWGGWLNVNGGASLTIPSGMLVTNDDPLRISSDGSGGTLFAEGVTFADQVLLGPSSSGTVAFDKFLYPGYNVFDLRMGVLVTDDDFSLSKAQSQGNGGAINLLGNWWGTTVDATIRASRIYDQANQASLPVINLDPVLTAAPVFVEHVAFSTPPSNVAAGAVIAPAIQVAIEDPNNNVVASDSSSVSLAIGTNPNGGTLRGTQTLGVVAGTATFSNLSIDKVGAGYTLVATDGSLASVTSASFNVLPPAPVAVGTTAAANARFKAGGAILINVTFSEPVTVTGTPLLKLSNQASASYASGSGTATLTFRYVVASGQDVLGLDYASTAALTLNGGNIADQAGNAAALTLPATGTDGLATQDLIIDTISPTVNAVISTAAANARFNAGVSVPIEIAFSEAVNVTGTPQLALNDGATANYSSGNGTSSLTFTYQVAAGQNTASLDYASTNALTVGGGSVADLAGNAAALTLPATGTDGLAGQNLGIDTLAPTVAAVTTTAAANARFKAGATILINVAFSEAVAVTGVPQLALNDGATASYISGSSASTLTFTYVVAAGQNTTNLDYASTAALTLNGGTIADLAGNAAVLTLPATGSDGLAAQDLGVDTFAPTVAAVTTTAAAGTPFKAGATILINVAFSESVTVTGTPLLTLNDGATVNYLSGSGTSTLSFAYVVTAGQNTTDLDYASTAALVRNGGTLADLAGNAAVLTLPVTGSDGLAALGLVIDTTPPTIAAVTTPAAANARFKAGTTILINVGFSETVTVAGTPQLNLNNQAVAGYTAGSGSSTLTFSYLVAAGQDVAALDYASTAALALHGGTVADLAGNAAVLVLPATGSDGLAAQNISVDTTAPAVAAVTTTASANARFSNGGTIVLHVAFSEAVTVAGTPLLTLNNKAVASYAGGSGGSTLTFRYVVAAGQDVVGLDYASTAALALNGGTVADLAGNAAVLALPVTGTDGLASQDLVIDTVAPTVAAVTTTTAANAQLKAGVTVLIDVAFSKTVTVAGTPQLLLNNLGTANYTSGSGGSVLAFTYVVATGQNVSDLDYASTSALVLNGGAIADLAGNAAVLALPAVGSDGLAGQRIAVSATPTIVALYDPTTSTFHFRAGNSAGADVYAFSLGGKGDVPLVGDWDGTGHDGVGVYDPATSSFSLVSNLATGVVEYHFGYGEANLPAANQWVPLVGDWNGTGKTGVGLYDPVNSQFYLTATLATGYAQYTFGYGVAGLPAANHWQPLVGDWDGSGHAGVGLYDPQSSQFYLTAALATGYAQYTFGYGVAGLPAANRWHPLVGDWKGAGHSGVGLYDPQDSLFFLTSALATGYAQYTFGYGVANLPAGSRWQALVGDWTAVGNSGVGLYDPTGSTFYLTSKLNTGYADDTFSYGVPGAGWVPLSGTWNVPATLLATSVVTGANVRDLQPADVTPLLDAARDRWIDAGLPAAAAARLAQVSIVIADLPGGALGATVGSTIYLDATAAGNGWFLDATPNADEEFAPQGDATQLHAIDRRAIDHIDLLTVVAHELGHVAGLDDVAAASGDVMDGTLATGIRRLPTTADVNAL